MSLMHSKHAALLPSGVAQYASPENLKINEEDMLVS